MQELETPVRKVAWSLREIAESTGLSLGYLRNEVRGKRLPIRRFGRRILVLNQDLEGYLSQGSEQAGSMVDAA